MSLRLLSILFIFIAWCEVKAAPVDRLPLTKSPEKKVLPTEKDEKKSEKLKSHFSVAEPPIVSEKNSVLDGDGVYDFRQAFSFGLGGVLGASSGLSNAWSFQYLLPSSSNLHYEGGADLFNDGIGAFHFGVRRFGMKLSRLRGYYKAGLALRTDGESGLAEFVQLSNLRARGAIGFEKLWISPLSFRLETEASLGKNEQFILFKAALSWAWY